MSRISHISFFIFGAIIEEFVLDSLGVKSMIQQLKPIALLLAFAIGAGTLSHWLTERYKVTRKARKEADLKRKEKTIEELKKLQGYISDVRLTIDRGFLDNKSKHGGRLLLKKYEWLTGKVDLENGVSLRVIDDRIDKIIETMKIYSYQGALNELGVKEPRKEWDFGEGNPKIVEVSPIRN